VNLSPRERLEALRSALQEINDGVFHNTAESLLEWHLRRLELETELLKVEAILELAERGNSVVSFPTFDSVTGANLSEVVGAGIAQARRINGSNPTAT